jgi:hypothetical protein
MHVASGETSYAFGQRHALRPNAVADARRVKPSIPQSGAYGLPIRDEIDLILDLR